MIELSRSRRGTAIAFVAFVAFVAACAVTFTTSLSFKLGQLTSIFADLEYHLFCITYCYSAQHVMSGYLLSLATMVIERPIKAALVKPRSNPMGA
ncbi:hypothetical protein EDC96DRAFT_579051 [Choanephora cucurbitarum]|nr:hypothetical protein EDC96DRAFT_579051 [Choanephora cucurbitarum]